MYKFTFEEKRRKYGQDNEGKQVAEEVWEEVDSATTSSKGVMAGILRAKADELDPPQKVMR